MSAHFAEVPIDAITPNPRQPRTAFDEEALAELVHSIRRSGCCSRSSSGPMGGGRYELVMGERRWRAARRAGLAAIPAIVRETADDDLLRDALLENLHRSQLNPLEEAAAYDQLLEDFGCTHDELAQRIGRSRPQISNTLRLLRLPPAVQRRVAAGVLSAGACTGAARADRRRRRRTGWPTGSSPKGCRCARSRRSSLSVTIRSRKKPRTRTKRPMAPGLAEIAARLSDRFETRVRVDVGRTKGTITIDFGSLEDLHRILALEPCEPWSTRTTARVDKGLVASGPAAHGARSSNRPVDRARASPRSCPAAAAACGNSDVSVMPGATLTSRNHGVPSASTIRSVRDRSRRRRAWCAVTAAAAQRAATSSGSRAGAKNSVAPAV